MAYTKIDEQFCPYTEAYRCEFIVDSEADIATLPKCCAGSQAIVMDGSGSIYMTNTKGEWRKL